MASQYDRLFGKTRSGLSKGMYPAGAYLDEASNRIMVPMTLKVAMSLDDYNYAKGGLAGSGYTVRAWAESVAQAAIEASDFVPDFMKEK